MSRLSPAARFCRRFWASALLLLGLSASSLFAIAPKAPSNLDVQFTLAIDSNASGQFHTYLLRWRDNALDESGYRLDYRLGNVGPFSPLRYLAADTSVVFLPLNALAANTLIQFQVVAYKYNGAKTETSSSGIVQWTIPATSTGEMNAPSGLAATAVNDGVVKLTWNDNSTNEVYHQIFYRKSGETTWTTLTFDYFNIEELQFRAGLIPGTTYQFAVRATRRTNNASSTPNLTHDSTLSNIADLAIPALSAPTNLTSRTLSQSQIQLAWQDNSNNETGYEIQYKALATESNPNPAWQNFTTVDANTSAYTITTGPGVSLEWRVRAVYAATGITTITTAWSNISTRNTEFPPPTGLTAAASGVSGAVDLTWQDIAEAETNYDVYARPVGTTTWLFAKSLVANSTRATVTESSNDGGNTFTPLAIGTAYEFSVEARYGGTSVSPVATPASATPRYGFTSRTHHPAKVGDAFSYAMSVSNNAARTAWSITGLPEGLSFDSETGIISGTPQESGLFVCPMTVTYGVAETASTPLTLRVLPDEAGPTVAAALPNLTLGTNTQLTIPLTGKFADADAEMAVKLNTTKGDVDILLYPSLTPEAVDNFMGYVESGAYNGVIFHRSVPNFVVQGGAYQPVQLPNVFASLVKRPSPRNEPGISNRRGTIAAAKVGGSPDSATHDFFFNLEDNSLKTGVELDNQNGGFTAFARVAGTGMAVVDAIAALPIGVYKDYNASGGTNASLDKRVVLDGSKANSGFEDVPMDATGVAPASMDASKTVRILNAAEIPVLNYEVQSNSNPAALRASIAAGSLLLEGLAEGASTLTVLARDLDGNSVTQSFSVAVMPGLKLPAITRQPVSVATVPGGKAKFSVSATGSNLTYQWFKGGSPIDGATLSSLSLTNVQAADEGSYTVQVGNASTTRTSTAARLDLQRAPVITTQPAGKLVEAGKALELTAAADGAPAPSLTWRRSGKTVSGQKQAKLSIAAAQLTDAGAYTLLAKNKAGSAISNEAAVVVVDKTSRLAAFLPGKTAVLKAQAAGPGLFYQWKRNDQLLLQDTETYSGTQTPTLTIRALSLNEVGNFTCVVTNEDESLSAETGAWRVAVVSKPNPANFTADTAYVGLSYDYTVPGGGDSNTSISSFTITGLPSGLRYDKITGRITGQPTRPGNYTLKVTAKNPAGSKTVSAALLVAPLPEATVGSFAGQIAASPALNKNHGGRIDLTVTDGGAVSGKITLGKTAYSFIGQTYQAPGTLFNTGLAVVTRKGTTPLVMSFRTLAPSGYSDSGDISGTITDGVHAAEFIAYRRVYSTAWRPNDLFDGRYNVGLQLTGDKVGNDDTPQGHGYFTAKIDRAGTVLVSGRLADGTTLTSSAFLGGNRQFLVYQSLYKDTGAVVGQASLGSYDFAPTALNPYGIDPWLRVAGSLRWIKQAQSAATERTYRDGFGPVTLDALGMTYIEPSGSQRILSLPSVGNSESNASLDFNAGGLEDSATNPDVTGLRITSADAAQFPGGNPGNVNLNISAGQGLISGSFELSDPPSAPSRKASFNGILIPQIPPTPATSSTAEIAGAGAVGLGHFLLAQLPSATPPVTTLSTSPILSGSVRLTPVQIVINAHPQSATLNPGTNVTFTVTAAAPGGDTLSYQWRKNGTSISGATTDSYALTSLTEAAQGTYDVVITTAYSRVVSNPAVLDVNDPVTNVIIARTPNTSPVAAGTSVTFSLSSLQGSGTLSYQWFKNSEPIAEATAASYTIASVTTADNGNYSLRVSSSLTPSGTFSASVPLSVVTPVTDVVATRTPSTQKISIGGAVTFSVTAGGGSLTYQWRKNGADITGATQATYYLNFVGSDSAATYTVLVRNAASPDGVESNPVPLEVDTAVSGVVASRTPADAGVPAGTSVTFAVSSLGAGPLSYQWRKNGIDIPGATQASYQIGAVSVADTATYTVLVSNASTPDGVLSNPVSLLIAEPVTQVNASRTPDDAALTEGQGVQFDAVVNGTAPHTYQWYRGGILIDGATGSSYSVGNLSLADAGDYTVVVKNAATPDGVTSNSVSLSVNPAPPP